MENYDFSGWATVHNVRCSDGRTITKEAFKHCDGMKVPLVWSHQHNDPTNVLGHACLEYHDEGVRAYGFFNDTYKGQETKCSVEHGDIVALSIFANNLQENGPSNARSVFHGDIKEVSLVLAGANPGAFIDKVLSHSDGTADAAVIYTGESISLYHSDDSKKENEEKRDDPETNDDADTKPEKKKPVEEAEQKSESDSTLESEPGSESEKDNNDNKEKDNTMHHSDDDSPKEGETLKDVFDTLTDKQKTAVYGLIGDVIPEDDEEEPSDDNETKNNISHKEDNEMKNNVFDQNDTGHQNNTLSHAEITTIIGDAKRFGSLKESFLAHAQEYGIENIDYLFPEAKTITNQPEFIKRDTSWVNIVMSKVHHTPFSRVKSVFANITEDDARARGYMKGNLKKEEVFTLLKRTTTPTTVYKKQKLDRDDVNDITDLDVIAWLKSEMRMMLDEELARAILVGDGRLSSSDDKINEQNIRPIASDAELYTIRTTVNAAKDATADDKAKAFIRAAIKSRKDYKGSGQPYLFATEDMITDCLLLEDKNGRVIYETMDKLKNALRVSEIVSVPVMEGVKGASGGDLMGIIVNLDDYNVGADKGGSINMFDDFDIDYNQMKYLIETRCSGALTKPYSAIAIELNQATA